MDGPRLIHPIYLDVSMLISFAAAIEGGISFGSEITVEKTSGEKNGKNLSGKLKLSNLFQSFVDLGLDGSKVSESTENEKETKKEAKAHTEASIAIVLYDKLLKEGGIVRSPQSLSEMSQLGFGALVELPGILLKNSVDSMLDFLDVAILASSFGGDSRKNDAKKQIEKIKLMMEADRNRTPLSNVGMQCDNLEKTSAIITLRRENLRDLTFSELNKNRVMVVGKITRFIPEGETMSAFENYGLSMLPPAILDPIFESFETLDFRSNLGLKEISGPAVQLLPLMIFV